MKKEISNPEHRGIWLGYMLVFALSAALYVATCAPGLLWQDSSLLVYRIWNGDLEGEIGLALSHPLYILMGMAVKSLPFGELAYKINLMSVFFGAIAVANLFLLLRLWLRNLGAVIIGTISLALSWTFWQHSVLAEVYSLYMAQMFGELVVLYLYLKTSNTKYFYLLGFLNGLSISNHMWGSFGLACYGILVATFLIRKKITLNQFFLFALLWIIGASPYEYLIIKSFLSTGDLQGTIASALFGTLWSGSVLNTSISGKIVFENLIFIFLNFPTPNLLLIFAGLVTLCRSSQDRIFTNIVLVLTLLYFVFAFRYTVADRYAFFLPFYGLSAILLACGANALIRRYNKRVVLTIVLILSLLPIPVYAVTPTFARKAYKGLAQRRQLPYRDDYKYFLQPWKTGYLGTEKFISEAFESLEQNAVFYVDSILIHTTLYAQQARGLRPDVKITSKYFKGKNATFIKESTFLSVMNDSTVYVVSPVKGYCPDFLLENYEFVKTGVIYKVVPKK